MSLHEQPAKAVKPQPTYPQQNKHDKIGIVTHATPLQSKKKDSDQETNMESAASIIAIVAGIATCLLIAVALPLVLMSKRAKEAEAKAHARRLADANMNARLLRLNL